MIIVGAVANIGDGGVLWPLVAGGIGVVVARAAGTTGAGAALASLIKQRDNIVAQDVELKDEVKQGCLIGNACKGLLANVKDPTTGTA